VLQTTSDLRPAAIKFHKRKGKGPATLCADPCRQPPLQFGSGHSPKGTTRITRFLEEGAELGRGSSSWGGHHQNTGITSWEAEVLDLDPPTERDFDFSKDLFPFDLGEETAALRLTFARVIGRTWHAQRIPLCPTREHPFGKWKWVVGTAWRKGRLAPTFWMGEGQRGRPQR